MAETAAAWPAACTEDIAARVQGGNEMPAQRWAQVNRMAVATIAMGMGLSVLCTQATAQDPSPKDEVFGGYSVLFPNGWAELDYKVNTIPNAFDFSNTYYFCKFCNVGLLLDGSGHFKGGTTPPNLENGSDDSTAVGYALAGLQYKWHHEKWSPFVRGFLGAANISPDCCHGTQWRFAAGGGGGLDWNLSRRISLRLIQVDYIYSSYPHLFVPQVQPTTSTTAVPDPHPTEWNSIRLAFGVVFNLGSYSAPPSTACVVTATSPTEVWVGERIQFKVNGTGFNPRHTVNYSWKANGGKLSSANTAAIEVDTLGLAAGSYTVTAVMQDPQTKSSVPASCIGTFLVKIPAVPVPPTVKCVSMQQTVAAGTSTTLQMIATSSDGRPLTYQWQASGGQLVADGASATFTPRNEDAPGTITVTGTVNDDRNLSAHCVLTLNVPPLPPPCVKPDDWGKCTFVLNPPQPAPVDNDCKDTLDRVALDIQAKSSGKLVIVGSALDSGKNPTLGPQRAENAKYYLTTTGSAKVDPARIETRQGASTADEVHFYYIPDGILCAGPPDLGSTVDEEKVKGVDRGKLPTRQKQVETPQ